MSQAVNSLVPMLHPARVTAMRVQLQAMRSELHLSFTLCRQLAIERIQATHMVKPPWLVSNFMAFVCAGSGAS